MYGMVDFGQCPLLPTFLTADPLAVFAPALSDHCLTDTCTALPDLREVRQPYLRLPETR